MTTDDHDPNPGLNPSDLEEAARDRDADLDDPPTTGDPALDTALDLLDEAICECGHLDSSHAGHDECQSDDPEGTCDCREFRPVAFHVERADKEA